MSTFNLGEHTKKLNTPTEEQKFVCRFIVLKNWIKPRNGETFEPYYQELTGLQVEGKLYYEDPYNKTRITYTYINKENNFIKTVFDGIPEGIYDGLVTKYHKKSHELEIAKRRYQESLNYHEQK